MEHLSDVSVSNENWVVMGGGGGGKVDLSICLAYCFLSVSTRINRFGPGCDKSFGLINDLKQHFEGALCNTASVNSRLLGQ